MRLGGVLLAGLTGVVFAVGLLVSGMTRTDRVVAFLDVGGAWDPALALVMVGAIGVMAVAWRIQARLAVPLLGGAFALPERRDIDAPLVVGSVIFGVGWGLSGFCPAPAIVAAGSGSAQALWFSGATVAGMLLHRLWSEGRSRFAQTVSAK